MEQGRFVWPSPAQGRVSITSAQNLGVNIQRRLTRWYCKYGISYRDLEEMMAERGGVPFGRRSTSMHAAVYNIFNVQRHLISRRALREFRTQAMAHWQNVANAA